jgi:hypothetical protein
MASAPCGLSAPGPQRSWASALQCKGEHALAQQAQPAGNHVAQGQTPAGPQQPRRFGEERLAAGDVEDAFLRQQRIDAALSACPSGSAA